jgi:hypothetical protein
MADLKFAEFVGMPKLTDNKFGKIPLDELPLTMSYVPMQCIGSVYAEDEALMRGTLFPELDKPFKGKFTGGRK